jgi:hypothetical protein
MKIIGNVSTSVSAQRHTASRGVDDFPTRRPPYSMGDKADLPAEHPFAGLRLHHYRCVLIDPPTKFVTGTKGRPQHYGRMTDAEIAALPVGDLLQSVRCVDLSVGHFAEVLCPTRLTNASIA